MITDKKQKDFSYGDVVSVVENGSVFSTFIVEVVGSSSCGGKLLMGYEGQTFSEVFCRQASLEEMEKLKNDLQEQVDHKSHTISLLEEAAEMLLKNPKSKPTLTLVAPEKEV